MISYFIRVICLILILTIGLKSSFAQTNLDEVLATEYFNKAEYDKAAIYYKKLLELKPSNSFYYKQLLSCYLSIKDYKNAEKDIKFLQKKVQSNPLLSIDLGYIYQLGGNTKDAQKVFKKVIEQLPPNEEQIQNTAEHFELRGYDNYALETYQQGNKIFKNDIFFLPDIGNLLKKEKRYKEMTTLYLKWLDKDPSAIFQIRDLLQESIEIDEVYQSFKVEILKKSQEQPDNYQLSDVLAWLFLQKKDFTGALIQYKSIDKRLKEGGRRLVELARIASNYNEFDIAEKSYNAVIEQGVQAIYYFPAEKGLLDIKYNKITLQNNYTQEDIIFLLNAYDKFLEKAGWNRNESYEVALKQAEILALYNNNIDKAITILERLAESSNQKMYAAKAKLALGDYYLLLNNPWEATLRYSQVEKMYKDAPLGHEAKFRNAKMSFYKHDFEWASAQLNVLKGSTSELIANDALQLSLLIQENTGWDSTEKALELFADAQMLVFKNQFNEAKLKMDSIVTLFPQNTLIDDIEYLKADICIKKKEYDKALTHLTNIFTNFKDDILADDALFRSAQIYDNYLNQKDVALKNYEKLILEYKGSVFTNEAGIRYRKLRGDVIPQ